MIDLTGVDPWSSVGGDMSGSMFTGGSFSGSNLAGMAGSAFGPLGSVAGSALGGLLGGGSDSEDARKARQFNFKMAQYYAYLNNHAHQYEVQDLKKAGLNPMLSVMGGRGAGVTSAGSPSFMPTGTSRANSAMKGAELGGALTATVAGIAKTLAETQLATAQSAKVREETPLVSQLGQAEIANKNSSTDVNYASRQKILAEVQKVDSEIDLNRGNLFKLAYGDMPKLLSEIANIDIDTTRKGVQYVIDKMSIPGHEVQMDFNQSWMGAAAPYLRELANIVGMVTGGVTAGAAVRAVTKMPDRSKFESSAGSSDRHYQGDHNVNIHNYGGE